MPACTVIYHHFRKSVILDEITLLDERLYVVYTLKFWNTDRSTPMFTNVSLRQASNSSPAYHRFIRTMRVVHL